MHRVNILLDDTAWAALQEVPRGERSKMVSKAIKNMADVAEKMKAATAPAAVIFKHFTNV